ncbi:MAG: TIGR04076 family protein [Desulfurococcaceae archaeon]
MMPSYRIKIVVKEVRGSCALGYKPGDIFEVKEYYIQPSQINICLHALIGMSTLLISFLKGASARNLGIGKEDDLGYVQCPDPGKPYTNGGTVLFELRREKV